MGVFMNCNECGHRQMIGYNRVDGRVKWWTRCESCGKGNFQAPPDPSVIALLGRIGRSVASDETEPST